jgi:hypothetical protein
LRGLPPLTWGFGTEAFFSYILVLAEQFGLKDYVQWNSFFMIFGTEALMAKNCVHGHLRI